MKIVVAPQARDDLKTAYAYIAEDKGGEASSSSRSPSRTSAPPSNALPLSSPPSGTIDCLVAAITSIRPPSLLPGEVPLSSTVVSSTEPSAACRTQPWKPSAFLNARSLNRGTNATEKRWLVSETKFGRESDAACYLRRAGTGVRRRLIGSAANPNPSNVNTPRSGSVVGSPKTAMVGCVRPSIRT